MSTNSARPGRGEAAGRTGFRSLGSTIGKWLDRLPENRYGLILFVPAALVILVIVVPPILAVMGMSLFRIELLREGTNHFVGLHNIQRTLEDADFISSIPRTIVFMAASTLLSVPMAVVAAMLMNQRGRLATPVSIAVLLPWTIAPIVTGLYWRFIFQPSFGIATAAANALGVAHGAVPWLQNVQAAFAVAIVANTWRTVPLLALILLAALKAIPDAQYRAARMDGATPWQSFVHITLPALRSTLMIVTALSVIISLQVFDIIFQLTRGGPGFETTTVAYYIYDAAFGQLSLGYSAMLAILLLALTVLLSASIFLFRQRTKGITAEDEELEAAAAGRSGLARISSGALEVEPSQPKPRRVHWSAGLARKVQRPIAAAIGLAFVVWSVGPTVWIAIASLQGEGAVTSAPLRLSWLPTITHYQQLLTSPDWIASIAISVEVSVGATFLALLLGSLAAYPLARLTLPGRNLTLGLLIFSQMVPAMVLAIPVLLIFNFLKLTDTVPGLVLANVAFVLPLVIWILKGTFEKVPRALDAAARMDGCGRLGTLFRVTLPAASAGIAATAVLLLISTWNEFLFAVILGSQDAITVTRRIGFIDAPSGVGGTPPYTFQATAGIVAVLPCLVLVALFHRHISSALTEGYMKG